MKNALRRNHTNFTLFQKQWFFFIYSCYKTTCNKTLLLRTDDSTHEMSLNVKLSESMNSQCSTWNRQMFLYAFCSLKIRRCNSKEKKEMKMLGLKEKIFKNKL